MEKSKFICANLLGDGYLPKTDYSLKIRHSEKQREYAKYKAKIAEKLGMVISWYEIQNHQYQGKNYPQVEVSIKLSKTEHAYYRNLFYPNGSNKDYVPKDVLNHLTEQELAYWWMDDGNLSEYKYRNRHSFGLTLKLSTHKYSLDDNEYLQNYFLQKWGVGFKIGSETKRGKKYYFLRCHKQIGIQFLNILKPYIPECMRYKVDCKYQ